MEDNNLGILKFTVQVIGEHEKLNEGEKSVINSELLNFAEGFSKHFSEGVLVADIRYKKGHFNKGKYRGVPLVYVKARFSTDKGVFFANKENWGAVPALHDTLLVLSHQIRSTFLRQTPKEKAHEFMSERKMVET